MKSNNLITLIISLAFSLVLLEVGLRIFTPFPVSEVSNQLRHEVLGRVMDPKMEEIDEHGFRNSSLSSIDVVALGDSHTYGFNVSSDNSWPKILGRKLKKNVYNFGVGGYGILQYQYLINKSIELKPEVILLGLYLANDLNDLCQLVHFREYWVSRAKEHHIDISLCPEQKKAVVTPRSITYRIWRKLSKISAIFSIASNYHSQYSMLKEIEDGESASGLVINDGKIKTKIAFKRINNHEKYMDFTRPHIQMAYEVLKKFLLEAKNNIELNNMRFGVLLIPSKELVLYNHLMKMGYNVPKKYRQLVENEEELKEKVSLALENAKIEFIDVLPDMENAILEHGNIYPIRDDGHPLEIGYQIYADNAFKLHQQLVNTANK